MQTQSLDCSTGYYFETVSTVSEFMQYIESSAKQLKSDLNRDEYLAFRGQSNCEYSLSPSLARELKHRKDIQMLHFEKELVYSAQHEHPKEFLNVNSPVELLIRLQHYGIPTRLLDITTNALVALYFACCSNSEKDGEVFILKLKRDYHWNDYLSELIADTYRLDISEKSIKQYYDTLCLQPYYKTVCSNDESLSDEENENYRWYDFRTNLDNAYNNPIVIQPPQTFARLNAQGGQFLLFSNDLCYDSKNIPVEIDSSISPLSKTHNFVKLILRVPSNCKEKIIKDLEVLGISRSSLFHDNIDVVCEEIVKRINNRTQNS